MIARDPCLLYVRVRIVQALTRLFVVCHGEAMSTAEKLSATAIRTGKNLEAVIIDLIEANR